MSGMVMKFLAPLGMLIYLAGGSRAAEPANFDVAVGPFVQKYWLRCPDAKAQEGEFRLDTLSQNFTDAEAAQRWDEVIFRMNSGEMPPEGEPQPTPDELGRVVDWLAS